ncbi:MAG: hypothetical protein PUE44_08215 [Bulleidia sp.]|nr:hypothetical protein [Bulleidia sp.]
MLKKLQNLLFEEDEDDFEEEEEEEIVPVRPQRPKKEATAPRQSTAAPKPVKETVMAEVEKPKQTMQRIDLTQPVETIRPKQTETVSVKPVETVKPKPVQEVNSTPPASLFLDDTPAPVTPKPKKLGITVDDAPVVKQPETKPVRTAQNRPSITPKQTKKEPVRNETGYVFKPVISPIFGVDEKDLHALKTTTNKISEVEKQKSTGVRPQIISPIYGAGNDSSASASKSVVEPSAKHETVVAGARSVSMEDTIPEFSLDDILKAKDEGVRKEAGRMAPSMPEFPDLDFDDDEDDKTILIKRSNAE